MGSAEPRYALAFFISFIFSLILGAQSIELSDFVEKKKFVLAGTITPPSVSLNGQQLETPSGNYKNLYVNGTLVPLMNIESLKTFYYSVESDSLSLEWEKSNGERINFLKLEFPSLSKVTTNGHELHWTFSSTVTQAKLDTQDISLESPVTKLDNITQWIKQQHVLEITSQKNNNQIYQLDFSSYQKEILCHYNFFYSLGESSLNYFWNTPSAGFGFGYHFEDNYYLDIVYHYSEKDSVFDVGNTNRPVNQKLYQLKSHYGYQYFNTNWNDFDLLRMHLGLQGEISQYNRISTTMDSFDGFFTDKVDHTYAVLGIFFRWEPWQYKNFGAALTLDFPLYSTNGVSKINTNAYFSINYNFK